ncbi:MAG TPA: hypothetical protein VGR03_09665 [Candidatus Acidoferrum sp.]|nr:hypothetical protein [Candidatus Acidoferrum sp.]
MKRSASVTAAAVVALICGSLALLFAGLGAIGVLLLRPEDFSSAQPMPALAKTAGMIGIGILFGWNAWVIVTGIGLLRLRNWARISILIISGITAFFAVTGLLVALNLTFPPPPGAGPDFRMFMHVFLSIFYGAPALMAVWWLILFNRKNVKQQFVDPMPGEASPAVQTRRAPLAIVILAWFLIVSSGLALPFLLLEYRAPMMLFGHLLGGAAGAAYFVAAWGLQLASGVGLLRLKRWSYPLTIGLQLFLLTSGIFTWLSPNFERAMRESLNSMGSFPQGMDPEVYLRIGMRAGFVGFLFPVLILGILIYYRSRFLESAALATKMPPE